MNLMSLINPSLKHVYCINYCSNLVSNHSSLIRLIRFVIQCTKNYTIYFLFRLNLILHKCNIFFRCDRFGILNFTIKQELGWAFTIQVHWTAYIHRLLRISRHDVTCRSTAARLIESICHQQRRRAVPCLGCSTTSREVEWWRGKGKITYSLSIISPRLFLQSWLLVAEMVDYSVQSS